MQRNPKQLAPYLLPLLGLSILLGTAGCHQQMMLSETMTQRLFGSRNEVNFGDIAEAKLQPELPGASVETRLAILSGDPVNLQPNHPGDLNNNQSIPNGERRLASSTVFAADHAKEGQSPKIHLRPKRYSLEDQRPATPPSNMMRAQSPGNDTPQDENQFGFLDDDSVPGQTAKPVQKVAFQYPELATPDRTRIPGNGLNSPNVGSPNELNPLVQPFERGGNVPFPTNYADMDIYVTETQTGRINFGGAYNSDNGIVGQFIIDEKNFDIGRYPRSFQDLTDGTAWRGAGQSFRLEIVPGANLERYLVSFSEPYMLGTDYSFSASAYLFSRQYYDWDEQRVGGRFAVGRRLTPDLSISAGVRLESVNIDNPRLNTSQELNDSLGSSNLNIANIGLVRDTRDSQVAATTGSFFSATFSQAFGDYDFSRADVDYRRYKLIYERPDGSGRHTLSYGTKLGFSGSSTPIFENYFAGGFSTLRGYDFRGAAPLEGGVRVGGEFQWLNTVEYMFPLTASDMVKGVVFCDFGTVEENIEINGDNFRVAPGFGLRVQMPQAGIGAPLAFDFAFPVASAAGDEEKMFSFYLGVLR